MKDVARVLTWRRDREGLTRREVAEIFNISASMYGEYERGNVTEVTKNLERILTSDYILEGSKDPLPPELEEVVNKHRKQYRIPDIPGFMDLLNEITDNDGYIAVPINDPRLQILREAIGGPKVYKGNEFV